MNSTEPEDASAAAAAEGTLSSREKLVAAREDALRLREAASDLREQEIRLAATEHAKSDAQMLMLQQANEHLVIATIEANRLAEQIQTAKAQLERAKSLAEKPAAPSRISFPA